MSSFDAREPDGPEALAPFVPAPEEPAAVVAPEPLHVNGTTNGTPVEAMTVTAPAAMDEPAPIPEAAPPDVSAAPVEAEPPPPPAPTENADYWSEHNVTLHAQFPDAQASLDYFGWRNDQY